MVSETQTIKLFNGGSMEIERNGRHQYRVENGDWKPSVTTMLGHLDAGAFGIGMNWALKMARENDGDLEAPRRISKEAQEQGTKLHEAIEAYINTREIDESNLAFTSWLKEFSTKTFRATELFCYNPELQYGGTIDAITNNENGELEIWDWKTKENLDSYRSLAKDGSQVGAYSAALRSLGSVLAPTYGYVAYIMRDGSGVHVDQVDLAKAEKLFLASRNVYNLLKENK